MTFHQAMAQARRRSRRTQQIVYVVFEAGEYDSASDYDLDTYYLGADPVASVEPDGSDSESRPAPLGPAPGWERGRA